MTGSRNQLGRRAFANHASGWRATLVAVGLAGAAACATPAKTGPVVADTERAMVALRAKNAGYLQRIEELENRIFILEDQLDSRRIASERRAPTLLPARVIRADTPAHDGPGVAAPAGAAASQAEVGSDQGESSLLAEQAVDYEGDALQTDAARTHHNPRLSSSSERRPRLQLSAPEPIRDARLHPSPAENVAVLRLYRDAMEALRAGNQKAALAGFRRFLDGNPRHAYADNAQYWIGECFYDVRDYRSAEVEFRRVIERYPQGNKVPDAMLKLGFTLLASGQKPAGLSVLESLARSFPKHDSARLASFRLAHPEDEAPAAPPSRSGGGPTLGTVAPLPPAPAMVPATLTPTTRAHAPKEAP